jgi:hypothetical protein
VILRNRRPAYARPMAMIGAALRDLPDPTPRPAR